MLDLVDLLKRPNKRVKSDLYGKSWDPDVRPLAAWGGDKSDQEFQKHQRCIMYHKYPRLYLPRSFRMFQDVSGFFGVYSILKSLGSFLVVEVTK